MHSFPIILETQDVHKTQDEHKTCVDAAVSRAGQMVVAALQLTVNGTLGMQVLTVSKPATLTFACQSI